jgi:ribosomal protein S18 acetylase RimI-like enzyme
MKNLPTSDVTVRRLKKEDAADVKRIYEAITKRSEKLDIQWIVEDRAEKSLDASFVAEFDGNVVGYMISYITSGNFGVDRCAWISMFGVEPKFMGQGIGRRLAGEIFRYYKEKDVTDVFTSVRWDYTDILSFFKTLGFQRSEYLHLHKVLQ